MERREEYKQRKMEPLLICNRKTKIQKFFKPSQKQKTKSRRE